MTAEIFDFQAIRRQRSVPRLRAELESARESYVRFVQCGAALLQQAGWVEGMAAAEIVDPDFMAEARRAADLFLASERALLDACRRS